MGAYFVTNDELFNKIKRKLQLADAISEILKLFLVLFAIAV